jgi:hypothetical protein
MYGLWGVGGPAYGDCVSDIVVAGEPIEYAYLCCLYAASAESSGGGIERGASTLRVVNPAMPKFDVPSLTVDGNSNVLLK